MYAGVEIKLILSKEVHGCGLAEKLMSWWMIKRELLSRKYKEIVPAPKKIINPSIVTEMNKTKRS